jgi:DNA polymerase III subunit gamma/tau
MASIYQRARPRRFDEVVGQEHVKDVLLAALRRGQVGHAYLFSGPRGVGKTTTARLLAMAVNCDADRGQRPCGDCESCLLVQRGEHPDVIELDAASNNSVDDVRDLREKVRLASLRGGRRVWVLDEAHMLSRAAANALLKTLEEPPPGLVFVLATTEPEKLPPRCSRAASTSASGASARSRSAPSWCGWPPRPGSRPTTTRWRWWRGPPTAPCATPSRCSSGCWSRGQRVTRDRAEAALGLPPQASGSEALRGPHRRRLGRAARRGGDLYRDGFAPRTVAEQLGRALRDGCSPP